MSNAETTTADELQALEAGALDPSAFPHQEHVRLAYGMLERYPFGEAVSRFSRGAKLLAAKAGRPEVYHETITVAFLAVIGERRARARSNNWSGFKAENGDLFDKRFSSSGTTGNSSDRIWRGARFVCLKERRFPNRRLKRRRAGDRRSLMRCDVRKL